MILVTSMGCSKRADPSPAAPKAAAPSESVMVDQSLNPLSLEPNLIIEGETPTQAVIKLVQGSRSGFGSHKTVIAMHELLKKWNPEGKGTEELIRVLGQPNETQAGSLIYKYHDFESRYELTFSINNGIVQSTARVHVDLSG